MSALNPIDYRLDAARAALLASQMIHEADQDDWIAIETARILADEDLTNSLVADAWEVRPTQFAHIARAMIGNDDFLRRAAMADLNALCERVAESEACRRYQELNGDIA